MKRLNRWLLLHTSKDFSKFLLTARPLSLLSDIEPSHWTIHFSLFVHLGQWNIVVFCQFHEIYSLQKICKYSFTSVSCRQSGVSSILLSIFFLYVHHLSWDTSAHFAYKFSILVGMSEPVGKACEAAGRVKARMMGNASREEVSHGI